MKARRVAWLVLALATIAALAWLAVRPPSGEAAPVGSRSSASEPHPADGAPLVASPRPERAAIASASEPVAVPAETAPQAVASEGEPPAERTQTALVLLVTDHGGAPIAAAHVALRRGSLGHPLEEAVTDDVGCALLQQADVGDRVGVRAPGFEETRMLVPARPWAEPTVVVLQRGTLWLVGTLVDDANVALPDTGLVLIAHSALFHARTDAQGRFAFHAPYDEPPPQAGFDVEGRAHRAPAGGASLPWSEWLALGWPRLVAERLAVLELTVLDPSGAALGDARVIVRQATDEASGTWRPGAGMEAFVREANGEDAAGRPLYTLHAPARTPLWLEVAQTIDPLLWVGGRDGTRAYARLEVGVLAPAERVARSVQLEISQAQVLQFRVRDEDGAALVGARAWISDHGAGRGYLRTSGDDGGFSIAPPSGDWTVTVRANGFAPWERAYAVRSVPDGTVEVVLTRSDIGIEVLVRDQHGLAFEGARISMYSEGKRLQVANGVTDADGRFAWHGLDPSATYRVELGGGQPGSYLSEARSGGQANALAPDPPVHQGVRAGATRIEFRILPAGSIAGVVVGAIAPGSFVELRGTASGLQEIASDGRFAFVGLPVGHYRLGVTTLEDDEQEPAALADIDLAAGQDVGGVELKLR